MIRMGALASIAAYWLPSLLKEFQQKYPHVEFVIHQGDYTSIQEGIKTGALDFGFVSPDSVSGLETIPLKEGAMLAILQEEHPLAQESVVLLADLVQEPYILMEEGNYYEPMKAFEALGLKPNVKYTIHNDHAIMAMVEAGLGVSLLAELMMQRIPYHIAIRPTDPPVTRTIAIGYKDWASLPIASKRFIEYLRARVDALP